MFGSGRMFGTTPGNSASAGSESTAASQAPSNAARSKNVAAASPWEEHQSVPAQQGCACHFGLQCERLPAPRNGQARVRLDD